MNYFVETQKGATKWDTTQMIVQENRTEALDTSRRVIRDGRRILPRQSDIVREFAKHVAADAKRLHEDQETGAQAYRYVKTGTNHFSLAFTYDCIAAQRASRYEALLHIEHISIVDDGAPWLRIVTKRRA